MNDVNKISKGLLLMVAGLVLLFYALGILTKEFIIILIAIYLFALGFIQFGGLKKAQALFKKKE